MFSQLLVAENYFINQIKLVSGIKKENYNDVNLYSILLR